MNTSLSSGLSGLRAHQQYLDVIGHNLANVNTEGFKGSRVTFSDLYGTTLDPGSAPSTESGGINPDQVGAGVSVASVDQQMGQGSFRATGRELDLAIEGYGFFALQSTDGLNYTRVGAFAVDGTSALVDQRTGYRVLSATGSEIVLPLDSVEPGRATSSIELQGNLPAEVKGPFAEVLVSSIPWAEGTAAQLSGTNSEPFILADGQTLSVRVNGGTAQTVTFRTADFGNIAAATASEIAAVINGQVTGVTAAVNAGAVVVTSDRTGSKASIDVDDGLGSPAATLGLGTTLTRGTETAAAGTTAFNDLADNLVDYVVGDQIHTSGTEADGTGVSATFVFGAANDGTTLADMVSFISNQFTSATASIDASGRIVLTADQPGDASLSLTLTDDTLNTGSTSFGEHILTVDQPGAEPDRVMTAIQIFDSQGRGHTLELELERTSNSEWSLDATLGGTGGTMLSAPITGIRFGATGAFEGVVSGSGSTNLQIRWDDLGGVTQDVALDIGSIGKFDGLTQFGGQATAQATTQDGNASGTLESLSVSQDGKIQGFYSNGRTLDLAEIGIATFSNPGGLTQQGASLYSASSASGEAQLAAAESGGRGSIRAGNLEQSNVDLAQEFVRLIEAQRGFQANARVISTTDEVLAELVQVV